MPSRLRVYVAGPISKGDIQHNVDQGREAGIALINAGFAPLVPQLTCFLSSNKPSALANFDHQTWIQVDLPWVEAADAVLRLPGESVGADIEVDHARKLGIPVYFSTDDLIANPPKRGHDGYLRLLKAMELLHKKKAADYGDTEDPLANIRASEQIGIPAWLAAYLRSKDKVKRIDAYCRHRTLANEGVEDSFMDNAAYNLIALLLFREDQANRWAPTPATKE